MRNSIILLTILFVWTLPSYSQEIKLNKIYTAKSHFPHVYKLGDSENKLTLKRKSKIHIIMIDNENADKIYYFRPKDDCKNCKIIKRGNREEKVCKNIEKSHIYYFCKSSEPELYLEEWQSVVHGTLVVPFKVRTKDGRLMGDATLGYYVGKEFDFLDIEIKPLISFGLSTITVPVDDNSTETKTGITGAAGLILTQMGGNFQIGMVGGIDHLGGDNGDNWEYEDDLWFSFMVGYNFAQ